MRRIGFRDLERRDQPTLEALATFREPGDDHAFGGWDPERRWTDYGRLAFDAETGEPLGAAWYRSETFEGLMGREHGDMATRELFVGVFPQARGRLLGWVLAKQVAENAIDDRRVGRLLVVAAKSSVARACRRQGFWEISPGRWLLELQELRRQRHA